MFKKHSAIILPTDKATSITQSFTTKKLFYNNNQLLAERHIQFEGAIPQHLYILSDEEIKKGNWIYNKDVGIVKCLTVEKNESEEFRFNYEFETKDEKCWLTDFLGRSFKVIASTDKSLGLPSPSDSFIKKYCELGDINEVMVEYEEKIECEAYYAYGGYDCHWPCKCKVNLNVALDNTITIKKVKESWSKEEVIGLLNEMVDSIRYDYSYPIKIRDDISNKKDKWIEENLY